MINHMNFHLGLRFHVVHVTKCYLSPSTYFTFILSKFFLLIEFQFLHSETKEMCSHVGKSS